MDYKNLDAAQLKARVLLRQKIEQEGARTNFMRFVKAVWPEFVEGPHHQRTSEKFQNFSTKSDSKFTCMSSLNDF